MLPPGAVDALTRLVLANAVYFKAGWQFPFNENLTEKADFYRLDGSTAQAEMMYSGGPKGFRAQPASSRGPASRWENAKRMPVIIAVIRQGRPTGRMGFFVSRI